MLTRRDGFPLDLISAGDDSPAAGQILFSQKFCNSRSSNQIMVSFLTLKFILVNIGSAQTILFLLKDTLFVEQRSRLNFLKLKITVI